MLLSLSSHIGTTGLMYLTCLGGADKDSSGGPGSQFRDVEVVVEHLGRGPTIAKQFEL